MGRLSGSGGSGKRDRVEESASCQCLFLCWPSSSDICREFSSGRRGCVLSSFMVLPSGNAAWLSRYFQLEPATASQDLGVEKGYSGRAARSGPARLRCFEASQRGFHFTEGFTAVEIVFSELQEAILNPPTIQDGPRLPDGGCVAVGQPAGSARVEDGKLLGRPWHPGLDGFDGQVLVCSASGTPKRRSARLMWFVRNRGFGEGRHRLAPRRYQEFAHRATPSR